MACNLAVSIAKGKVTGEQLIKILTNELVAGLLGAYAQNKAGQSGKVWVNGDEITVYWYGVTATVNRVRHVSVRAGNSFTAAEVTKEIETVLSLGAQQAIATLIQQSLSALGPTTRADRQVDNDGAVQLATRVRIAF